MVKKKRIRWTYEMIKDEAQKYKTRGEFSKGSSKAYHAAIRINILDDVCSHMELVRTNWTYEMIKNEAQKYKTRGEFRKGSIKAYKAAQKMNILDDVGSHMELARTNWTYDMIKDEAQKYKTRGEFRKGSSKAYKAAIRINILDDVCSHMEFVNTNWTYDMIKDEAQKYKTRGEFQKINKNAYSAAIRMNILDDVCSHMPKRSQFGKVEDYRNRKTILYYIKVNEYWKIGVAIHELYEDPEDTILKYRYVMDIKKGDVNIEIIDYKIYDDGYYAAYNEAEIKEMYQEDLYTGERILGCDKSGVISEEKKRLRETEIFNRDIYDDIEYFFR